MESQPQNPEFRNNPENFHPCCLLSCLLKYLSSLYCKQYGPRSDCSLNSSLIRVHIVCFHDESRLEPQQLAQAWDPEK